MDLYRGYRFPAAIICHCVWLYFRFCLSSRDVQEMMLERGMQVSHEAIRLWTLKFGAEYAQRLRRRVGRYGATWHLDEVFSRINGELVYLWRAVDQDGETLDVLVQKRRNAKAAKRFFRKLLKGLRYSLRTIVTHKLSSYITARAEVMPEVKPVYAGYIAWRGLVDESALPPRVHADIFDAMVFGLPPNEQFISYPVAGRDNDLRPGNRRCNFVWYRPADQAKELRRLLTDASGTFHALGIPPPLVRAEVIASLREDSRTLLAPQLDAVVSLTPQPFLQPIFDVETTRMAVGRVAIIGDAAFLARPHVAAGVTKAAEDAMALANALRAHGDVAAALAVFERERIPANQRIMQRGRELGGYLQPHLLTPAALAAAERHHTPHAIMSEIAVLDF